MRISLDISGIDEVKASLDEYNKKLDEGIRKGLAQSGQLVKSAARANCPVDTGNLRRSITKQTFDRRAVVGTNCDYAAYVEFGTCKMRAKPYLVPALLDNKDAVVAAMRAAIEL